MGIKGFIMAFAVAGTGDRGGIWAMGYIMGWNMSVSAQFRHRKTVLSM